MFFLQGIPTTFCVVYQICIPTFILSNLKGERLRLPNKIVLHTNRSSIGTPEPFFQQLHWIISCKVCVICLLCYLHCLDTTCFNGLPTVSVSRGLEASMCATSAGHKSQHTHQPKLHRHSRVGMFNRAHSSLNPLKICRRQFLKGASKLTG